MTGGIVSDASDLDVVFAVWVPSNSLFRMESVRMVMLFCLSSEIPDEFSFSWSTATMYWL